jgi:hypothetical protein
MSVATFTQLAAVDISSAATETTIYTLPASTVAQINSVRMVNRTAATVYVRAWAINDSSTPGENRELLVYDAPVPPGSWLELCDTKIIALSGASSKIRAQCDSASAISVIVSGMEIS